MPEKQRSDSDKYHSEHTISTDRHLTLSKRF